MKKFVFLLLYFVCLNLNSQEMTYVYLDLEYDVSVHKPSETDSIYIDTNSTVDITIKSWFLHTLQPIDLGIEVVIKDHDDDYNNNFLRVKSYGNTSYENLLIQDCGNSGSNHLLGYIYSSSNEHDYNNKRLKIPFQFESGNNQHCGFLFVEYIDSIIIVEGYSWNEIPVSMSGGTCECDSNYLETDTQVIKENIKPVKYYNLIGREIKDPTGKGLLIVLYNNNTIKKVYFN